MFVTTATSLRAVAEALAQDSASATSKTAKSTRGFCSTIRADFGPLASARITSRSSITTPSVEVIPTLRPRPLNTCAIIRDVVVLPLVPVTATIGTLLAAPGGKSRSTTGLAMYRLARENHPELQELQASDIPLDDPAVYELISRGDTAGVFQMESSGFTEMVMKMKPSRFEDIIAAGALYRPGPLDQKLDDGRTMVDVYIDRKHGRDTVRYDHPRLQPILEATYGVIVYQEQVMQISQALGGYSLGQADLLRRAMGKKKAEEMARERVRFMDGAKASGVDDKVAGGVFDLMEKFAAYGFNKSHSAAYGLLTVQTAWLKAHYPVEFMAALISSEASNTDKVVPHIGEARAAGIAVLQPDVNESLREFRALPPADGRAGEGADPLRPRRRQGRGRRGGGGHPGGAAPRAARSRASSTSPRASTPGASTRRWWRRW